MRQGPMLRPSVARPEKTSRQKNKLEICAFRRGRLLSNRPGVHPEGAIRPSRCQRVRFPLSLINVSGVLALAAAFVICLTPTIRASTDSLLNWFIIVFIWNQSPGFSNKRSTTISCTPTLIFGCRLSGLTSATSADRILAGSEQLNCKRRSKSSVRMVSFPQFLTVIITR